MSLNLPTGVQITAPLQPGFDAILTHDALALVAKLHRAFETRRQELLKARVARQASREERVAKADVVIDNSGTVADLEAQTDAAWRWIERLAATAS